MKIKKRITIMADILVDEDFDINFLCVCEDASDQTNCDSPDIFVGESENFEVLNYISKKCGKNVGNGNGSFSTDRVVYLLP